MLLLGTPWLVKNSPFWFFGLVGDTVSTRPHLLPYIFSLITVFAVCSFKDAGQNSFPWVKYHLYKNQMRYCCIDPNILCCCLNLPQVWSSIFTFATCPSISQSSRSYHFSILSSLKTDRISIFSFVERSPGSAFLFTSPY